MPKGAHSSSGAQKLALIVNTGEVLEFLEYAF